MPLIPTSLLATLTVDRGSGAITVLADVLAQAAGEAATTFVEVIADLRLLIVIGRLPVRLSIRRCRRFRQRGALRKRARLYSMGERLAAIAAGKVLTERCSMERRHKMANIKMIKLERAILCELPSE